MMENLEWILSIAGTAIGLLTTTLTFLARSLKSAKGKKMAENAAKLLNSVSVFVEEAERFCHYSGAEKKEYVITKANQFAIDSGIDFDAAAVAAKIEEVVELTKKVNARGVCASVVAAATYPSAT